jgi:hypothetical protein
MYVNISILLFCRYANHVSISRIIGVNHGDECNSPSTMRTSSICGKSFSFVEERLGPTCYLGIEFSCCIITKLKTLT